MARDDETAAILSALDALGAQMVDQLARQIAHEHLLALIISMMLAAVPAEHRSDLLNDLFSVRVDENLRLLAAQAPPGAGDLAVLTDLHLARIMREMAARIEAPSSVNAAKN